MTENEISKIIVNSAFQVYQILGPGLLESVYESALKYEIENKGLKVDRQVVIPVQYGPIVLDEAFRADLVVDKKVIVELKSVEKIKSVNFKQVLTYLKLTNMKLGLLINFNENCLKDGIKRIVNGLEE